MTTTARSPRPPSTSRWATGLAAAVLALACLCVGAGGSPAPAESAAEAAAAPGADETEVEGVATWEEVERLIGEQKMRQALAVVERILAAAREDGSPEEITRALVERTKITLALSGYETAVEELAAAERPDDARSRLVLDLVYGQALHAYLNGYRWEIEQRERVAAGGEDGPADLRLWTTEQIADEIYRAYGRAWEGRAAWGAEPVASLDLYVEPNDYPPHIRGTVRDAVSYLWAELLADSSLWRPEHANEVFRLDFAALIAGEGLDPAALADPQVHPLRRLAAVLGDLERWHASERPEAAFEARRKRLESLWSHASESEQAALSADLRAALDRLGAGQPWWSMGMATLAGWLQGGDEPDSLIQALEVARAGQRRHPGTVGGKTCRAIAGAIEAPSFSLQSMLADGAARRSLQVTHSNLERLYFRAYRSDVLARIEGSTDRQPFPDHTEVPKLLRRPPAAEWAVDLPRPGDHRPHVTYVTPPLAVPGLYTVVASARADFARAGNLRIGVNLIVTGLALITRPDDEGFEVTVRDGTTGAGLPEVEVMAFRADWKAGHRRVATAMTAAGGRAHLDLPRRGEGRGERYFLAARRGNDATADLSLQGLLYERERPQRDAALLYTDRSVYRPGQEVLWKAVVYGGGVPVGDYRVKPDQEVTVTLLDPNGQEAASRVATSNEFGSVAGRFTVAAGRPLGGWSLVARIGGQPAGSAAVQVEEYKRPTFEVTLDEPAEELRLNRPARVGGEARYYFGLPVTEGEVRWTVHREPLFPRWWFLGWWGGRGFAGRMGQRQLVAAGGAEIAADGSFTVEFLPEIDEREAEPGLTYLYRLEAEVTDPGGETRSAERRYRLGFVSVEAQVAAERGFWPAGEPIALPVERRDLDGAPRAGTGRWRLLSVEQPERAVPPAEQPVPPPPGEGAERFLTAGDRQRPRWQPGYRVEETLRLWDDGEPIAAGTVEHGEDGAATIELPALVTGVYRLRYATDDAHGATFETARELIVAADGGEPLALPAVLRIDAETVAVGGAVQVLVGSGLPGQELVLEIFHGDERIERRDLAAPSPDRPMATRVLSIPIGREHRGGLGVRLTAVADYQEMTFGEQIQVPWDDRRLDVRFATFRDRLRPGARETWRVEVRGADEVALAAGSAELLAYMYDRSLDLFAPHEPPALGSVYPNWLLQVPQLQISLGAGYPAWWESLGFGEHPRVPALQGDRLRFHPQYGIGGPGSQAVFYDYAVPSPMRMRTADGPEMASAEEMVVTGALEGRAVAARGMATAAGKAGSAPPPPPPPPPPPEPRSNFAETAFWEPQLLIGDDGAAAFEFTVPDSVTEWSVWAHALTRDLRFGSVERQARTVKELLVRPYVPRFLRERDRAELRVVVNNAGEEALSGRVEVQAIDPETGEDRSAELGLVADGAGEAGDDGAVSRPFEVAPDGSATVRFHLTAPARVGSYALEVWARAGDLADGERRPLPVLPGRLHLSESRFAALSGEDERTLTFAGLAAQAGADADPTLINDRLIVTLDGQLFYSVLSALPYLVDYPYECTEQTLNRFVSTGVVSSVFERYPAVAAMAAKLAAERDTRLEAWEEADPNRDLLLEETPWLRQARGGTGELPLIKVLDPQIAVAQRDASLARLQEAQTASGGFPWWPGGPPSPYMTVYLLHGLSRAIERDVEVPRPMVASAWRYLHHWWTAEVTQKLASGETCCVELVTFLNYVLSSYPDPSWSGDVFQESERRQMLEHSFAHWQDHSPLLKGYLALTLARAGRADDARLVFDAVLDSARTDPDLGTYWAPEERSWLWYNDTVEGHSFALYTLSELAPDDARRHGLVQWLMLDKKLGHWKSTRATAEAIWALVHYLENEGSLGAVEEARVTVGPIAETFRFEPDEYTGAHNRVVVEGEAIDPASMSTIVVEKETPGLLFASATWHFSTERLPATGSEQGLFTVRRRYFRRRHDGREWTLTPLAEGERLEVGDQVEVQLSITAKHAAEYVHLRDPRGAGFEPETLTSGYHWDLGIGYYEEIRDSGTNFFVEWLPAGEYTLTHRLRAATAGTFRTGPATLQSMYAPEFTAYSSGVEIEVAGGQP